MYAKMIEELAPAGHDPRHIEVIMWLRNPAFDGLPLSEFQKEVSVAAACVGKLGAVKVEEIARSLGFINSHDAAPWDPKPGLAPFAAILGAPICGRRGG